MPIGFADYKAALEEERREEERRKALEAFRAQEQRASWDVPSWTPPTVVPPAARVGMDDLSLSRVDTGVPGLDVTTTTPDTVAPVIQRRGSGMPPITLQSQPLAEELRQGPKRSTYSGWGGLSGILEDAAAREPVTNVPLVRSTGDVDTEAQYRNLRPNAFVSPPQLPQMVEPWQPPDWLTQGVGAVQQGAQRINEGGGLPFDLRNGPAVSQAMWNQPTQQYWGAQFERDLANAQQGNVSPQQGFARGLQAPQWAQGVGGTLGLTRPQTNFGWNALTGGLGAGVGAAWGAVDEQAKKAGAVGILGANVAFDPMRNLFATPADEMASILAGNPNPEPGKMRPLLAPVASGFQRFQEMGGQAIDDLIRTGDWGQFGARLMGTDVGLKKQGGLVYARDLAAFDATREYFNSLPAEQRAGMSLPWAMGISGGQAVWDATRDLATWEQQVRAKDTAAAVAQNNGDTLQAAQLGDEANRMRQMKPADIIEQYMDIGAELAIGIFADPWMGLSPQVTGRVSFTVGKYQDEAAKLFGIGADVAKTNIDRAAEAARPILDAVTQGIQADADKLKVYDPRTWWRLTPESSANRDADWMKYTLDFLLKDVTLKEDARTLLTLFGNDPMALTRGVPVMSPTTKNVGNVVSIPAGVVDNEHIATRYPILQLLPPDWVNNVKALAGEGAFEPGRLMAELDGLFYGAAQQYHGLGVIAGAPGGTASLRLKALPDGTAVVEYVGKDKQVISASAPMPMAKAQRQKRVVEEAGKKYGVFQLMGDAAQGLASFQRGVMSDMYLALSPRNWWRNAAGAMANAFGVDSYSWLSTDTIFDELGKDFPVAPGSRPFAAQAGYTRGAQEGGFSQPSSGIIAPIAEFITRNPDNPVSRFMRAAYAGRYSGPYGRFEVGIGGGKSIGIGEEANSTKVFYEGFRKTKQGLLEGRGDDLIAELSKLPNPPTPEFLTGLRNLYVEYGQKAGKQELLNAVYRYVNGDQVNMVTLQAMGIDPNLFTADGWKWLNDNIFTPIDTLTDAEYTTRVNQLIADQSQSLWKALNAYPPERGVYEWSDVVNPVGQAQVRDALTTSAQRAGLDMGQVQPEIDRVIEQIIQGEGAKWEAFRQDLAQLIPIANKEQAQQMWAAALDYWQDLYTGKQLARRMVDAAGGRAVAEQTQAAWQAKWRTNMEQWGTYGQQLAQASDEYRSALAGVMAGTPYSPKGSPWAGIAGWMQYDPDALAKGRSYALGSPNLDDSWMWEEVMAANRAYVDHSVAYLFDAFRRYPTQASFDILAHSMKEMEDTGGRVAHWLAEQRLKIPLGELSKEGYARLRNAAWPQGFDDMVAQNQAYARAMVATAVSEQAGDAVKWADEFAGGQFQLQYPNADKTWTARRLDDNQLQQFSEPGSGSALPEVPQEVLDAYMRTVRGEETVDQVMADVAQSVGAVEDYTPPASTQVMPGSLEAPYIQPARPRPGGTRPPVAPAVEAAPVSPAVAPDVTPAVVPAPLTVDVTQTKAAILAQHGDTLRAQGLTDAQMARMSKRELADRVNNPPAAAVEAAPAPRGEPEAEAARPAAVTEEEQARLDALGAQIDTSINFHQAETGGGGKLSPAAQARAQEIDAEIAALNRQRTNGMGNAAPGSVQKRIDADIRDLQQEKRSLGATRGQVLFEKQLEIYEQETKGAPFGYKGDDRKRDMAEYLALRARSEGRPIPKSILRDYPDLDPTVKFKEYDFTVPSFLDLDPDDKRSLYEVLRDNMFRSRKTSGTKADEMGDYTLGQIRDLDGAKRKLLEQLPYIRQGNIANTLTPAQRLSVWDTTRKYATSEYDNILAQSVFVGQKTSDWVMLNMRTGNRYIDQGIRMMVPFHYFVSRMPSRLGMLAINNPAMINLYWETQQEVDRYNQTQQTPVRMTDTIPLSKNLQVGNPLAFALPFGAYLDPNPFLNPENAVGPTEENVNRVLQWNPSGFLPAQKYALAAYLDWKEPLPDGKKRTDDFELGDFVPQYRIAGYAYQGATGGVGPQGALAFGDQYDVYRAKRTAGSLGLEREVQGEVVNFAQQIIQNRYDGVADMTNVDKRYFDAALALAEESLRIAGQERLVTTGSSWATGLPLYQYREGEQMGRAANRDYAALGYDETTNLYGSKAAQKEYMAQMPGLGGWWGKDDAQPGLAGQVTVDYDEMASLRAQKAKAEADAVAALPPDASKSDIFEAKLAAGAPLQEKIDALGDEIDRLQTQQKGLLPEGTPARVPFKGMSPAEMSDKFAQDTLYMARRLAGKPEWPGDDASTAAKQAYYRANDAYKLAQEQAVVDRLTAPVTSDVLAARRGPIVYTEEQARQMWQDFQNQGKTPEELARVAKIDAQNAANSAAWAARKQGVYDTFGGDVGGLYEQYLGLPKGDARAQFKAEHPELRAVSLYTWNPNEYQQLVDTYGQPAIMAWANTPAWADTEQSKAARNAYYDANPVAFEINAWLYGRPQPQGEADTTDDETFSYNFGADHATAKQMFGEDIWTVVGGYKRGWDKQTKAAYFDQYPQLSAFYDWWYAALPDNQFATTAAGYGGSRYYGGGGGYSSGDYVYEGGNDVYVDPRYMDRGLWDAPGRRQDYRPPTNNAWQWLQSAQMIGPDPIRKWQPPRWR